RLGRALPERTAGVGVPGRRLALGDLGRSVQRFGAVLLTVLLIETGAVGDARRLGHGSVALRRVGGQARVRGAGGRGSALTSARSFGRRHQYAVAGARRAVGSGQTRSSLPRLWARHASRYSALASTSPRRLSAVKPRSSLSWPKTGSTIALRRA